VPSPQLGEDSDLRTLSCHLMSVPGSYGSV
jgi:hypothetical protein